MKKIIIALVLFLYCFYSYSQEVQSRSFDNIYQHNPVLRDTSSNSKHDRHNRIIDTKGSCKNFAKTGDTFNVFIESHTPQVLVEEVLASGCISISNVVYNGSEESIGYFEGAQDIIGVNRGIILSTGKAINSVGENTMPNVSDWLYYPGDAALETIISEETNDAAVLEFNFIPASNKVKLEFVFASEEYPEFIEDPYVDPFAIFISGGPEQYDNENIALISGTQTNISTTTINSNVNSQYYISNWSPATLNTEFDGLTTTLTAQSIVTPGAEYTLKIAIADGMDMAYNSAVFLKAGSFTNFVDDMPFSVNTELVDVPNASTGFFTLYRTDILPDNQPIDILLSFLGSAQMGVDYSMIPDVVTIPANIDSIQISFEAFHYCGPDEKNIIISFQDNCNFNLENTNFDKEFKIIPVGLEVDFSVISLPDCDIGNGVVQALVANGTEPYNYLWGNMGSTTEQTATNLMAGYVSVTVSEATGCSATTDFMLDSNYEFIVSAEELSSVTCNNGNDGIIKIVFNGEIPYNLVWSNGTEGGDLNYISESEINLENLIAGNYSFTATDANNCMKYFSVDVTQPEAISCPQDLLLEINAEAFTFNGYIQPTGGIYYVDGVVQTEFLPAMYGLGEYNVFYEYIDAQLCSNTCNFNLIVYEDESLPDVTTLEVFEVNYISAVASGVVTNNHGLTVINRGFVWSTTEYPTILENTGQISYPGGVGEFQNHLLLLDSSTTYFVRAYATNINGISYGQSISFTTESTPSEVVLMQNGVVSTCDAVFYDTGGDLSNYSNNSNFILTIEPSEPNSRICLLFAMFDIEQTSDKLYVYDGPTVESTLIDDFTGTNILETICSSHPTGSLTIKFVSDGSVNKPGWAALISCESTSPCQNYSTQIVSCLPEPFSADSLWINLCQGQELTMSAEVDFFENNLYYNQSEAGLNSQWVVSSQNTYSFYPSQGLIDFSNVFDSPGLFFVYLRNTDERGCVSTIPEAYKVLVHETANMLDIAVSDNTICSNEQLSLLAETPLSVFNYSLNSRIDINSCLIDYEENEWALSFNEFEAGRQITSPSDISEICLGIEHSYIGELMMYIRCPNGQQIELLHYPNGCGPSFFGVPIDGTGTDCVPGELWNYCFSESATDTITTICQGQNSVPAGSYAPFQSFEGLIGCPLNGEWYFGIKDHLYSDDGTISYFEINFSDDLIFDTVISSYPTDYISWIGEGIDYNEGGFATAYPSTTGLNQYTLQFTGICGSFDTTINVFVEASLSEFNISPSSVVEFLQGDFAVLSVEAIDSAQYQWFHNGTLIENSNTSSLIVSESGSYSCVMDNSCNSILSTNSVLVNVHDSIICPENIIVCKDYGQIELSSLATQNGIFLLDGIIISEFNTFINEPGIYQLLFVIDYGSCSDTCNFFITINEIPEPMVVNQSPLDGILNQGEFGSLSLENTVIGEIYEVINSDNVIVSQANGTDLPLQFDYNFTEGSYSVISYNDSGCSRMIGNFLFVENTGVNKIVAQALFGDQLEILNQGEASIGLFRLSDTNDEVYAEDVVLLDGNSLAVFDNLEDGTYYLDSYILNSDISENVADHAYFQSSLIHENALQIVLQNSSVFPATIIHPALSEVLGTNSCSGVTYYIPETRNPVETENMIVILRNSDLNEVIGLSVTDINGYYSFDQIPDFANIQIFVTSLIYENYIPFETHTQQYEHYEVDFMIEGELIYPLISNNGDTLINSKLIFSLFPNPSNDFVNLSGISDDVELLIFDALGKLTQRIVVSNDQSINLSFLKSGTYYFLIQDKFGCFGIKKFVKQ